eukprot:CAMPEP_0203752668 /NCGR_PEP_ID=MMETSP0098-20131031/6550_1 /ASSEMBLY_ACC=CAM_ASM_000208 /TAXON_ID=96639 /ORGANISM=" , Strain NY0313808BC1" /LENGTH=193 /DNA_ID=CAMNT_0050642929 /DNA_START=457 /DNA_END=1038 /DNA_ORIENTATION=-
MTIQVPNHFGFNSNKRTFEFDGQSYSPTLKKPRTEPGNGFVYSGSGFQQTQPQSCDLPLAGKKRGRCLDIAQLSIKKTRHDGAPYIPPVNNQNPLEVQQKKELPSSAVSTHQIVPYRLSDAVNFPAGYKISDNHLLDLKDITRTQGYGQIVPYLGGTQGCTALVPYSKEYAQKKIEEMANDRTDSDGDNDMEL